MRGLAVYLIEAKSLVAAFIEPQAALSWPGGRRVEIRLATEILYSLSQTQQPSAALSLDV